jgi:GTPase SAR1 family protein
MAAKTRTVSMDSETKTTQRLAPKGLSRLFTYATGKDILVVGPSGAGKTKFAEYLRAGILGQEGMREMTYHITPSATFVISVPQRGFTLKVRRAVDTPGQTGPVSHASLIGERKPHAVIIVLDSSEEPSTLSRWLRLFCNRLDTILRKGSFGQKRLNGILVLLNKRDKITKKEAGRLRQDVEDALTRHLSVALGAARVQAIPILDCISVETRRGTALIDVVIDQLMERLAE